jgi:GntR family transcriptional regulator, transcriptional repressor for pyruvate dehydrogenase complex
MTGPTEILDRATRPSDAGRVSAIPLTAQALVDRLEADIVGRTWAPGDRIPSERKLVERFGVSRPIVREVLRRLQERGLIVVHPGRGSFVRELMPTRGHASVDVLMRRGEITVRDLVTARRMLEAEAAALAAAHHTDADAARMREILAAFDASAGVGARAELDVAFHEAIAVASGNAVIQIMFGSIRALTHGMVLRSLADRAVSRRGAPMHHRILDAIVARDSDEARAAMIEHVQLAETTYGRDIDRPLADVLQRRAEHQPEVAELLRRASTSLEHT